MGISSDLRNIKVHGSATTAELREFLAKMRGRSPQEVLGLVAESGLMRATIQSVIGCVLLLFLSAVIPFGWHKAFPTAESTAAKPAIAAPDKNAQPAADTQATAATGASAADKSTSPPTDVDKAAKAMGINDSKAADPKKNPLDKDLDKLLDDIK